MKNSNTELPYLKRVTLAVLVTGTMLVVAFTQELLGEEQVSPGVFDDRVVFGQSAAFTGPAQALG